MFYSNVWECANPVAEIPLSLGRDRSRVVWFSSIGNSLYLLMLVNMTQYRGTVGIFKNRNFDHVCNFKIFSTRDYSIKFFLEWIFLIRMHFLFIY